MKNILEQEIIIGGLYSIPFFVKNGTNYQRVIKISKVGTDFVSGPTLEINKDFSDTPKTLNDRIFHISKRSFKNWFLLTKLEVVPDEILKELELFESGWQRLTEVNHRNQLSAILCYIDKLTEQESIEIEDYITQINSGDLPQFSIDSTLTNKIKYINKHLYIKK